MFDINTELKKIEKSNFFSTMGIPNITNEQVILIENVEKVFINPSEFEFQGGYSKLKWLPTTISQEDPFYKKQVNTPELLELRKCINKKILDATKNMDKELFIVPPHDFSLAARNAICFSFRQLMTERYYNLGEKWEFIVDLYYAGHWPVGYIGNKIITI